MNNEVDISVPCSDLSLHQRQAALSHEICHQIVCFYRAQPSVKFHYLEVLKNCIYSDRDRHHVTISRIITNNVLRIIVRGQQPLEECSGHEVPVDGAAGPCPGALVREAAERRAPHRVRRQHRLDILDGLLPVLLLLYQQRALGDHRARSLH